jgi:signal transduction histidine kinase
MDAQVRGSGVGLSVVRHVVDAHRGTIQVDSRPGEGTTVTIALPVPM